MIKKIYGQELELTKEVCRICGCTTFEVWYHWDVLYSKCTACGDECLQTANRIV